MGKTNLDDLDLGRRGIEAAEVNSEAAAAGALLTADGQGGALWSTTAGKTSFAVAFHESEDEVTLGSWYDLHQAPGLYLYTAGWTLDPATGALIVPAEVGSGVAIVTVQVGFLTAGKSGHGLVRVRRAPALSPASFSTVGEGAMPLVDSAVATLRGAGHHRSRAGRRHHGRLPARGRAGRIGLAGRSGRLDHGAGGGQRSECGLVRPLTIDNYQLAIVN